MWRGYRDDIGRGQFRATGGIRERASRAAWRLYKGTPIGDLLVCHTCDNYGCVNPGHLYLGTRKQNTADMIDRDRMAYGTRHPGARLTEDAVVEIRLRAQGPTALATKFGVTRAAIISARDGKSWKHVTF